MNVRTMALDALKLAVLQNGCDMIMTGEELRKCESAIAALEADIAQAVEPVACAWAVRRNDGGLQLFFVEESARRESECGMWRNPVIPLYTAPPEPAVNAELLEALTNLVKIIESDGVANLTRGVELGQTVWFVKASDGLEYANAVITKATS